MKYLSMKEDISVLTVQLQVKLVKSRYKVDNI